MNFEIVANLVNQGDIMASRDVNLERIKLEVKKEMLLSIEGMATSITKPVKSSGKCRKMYRL